MPIEFKIASTCFVLINALFVILLVTDQILSGPLTIPFERARSILFSVVVFASMYSIWGIL